MKVRWTEGSIRFRITPTELRRLAAGEEVATHLLLPGGGGWHAAIRPGAAQTTLRAAGGQVVFDLSAADLTALSVAEAEGVYFTADVGGDRVRYFVEKDFPCVHPGAPEAREAPRETFTPPTGFAERHGAGAACGGQETSSPVSSVQSLAGGMAR